MSAGQPGSMSAPPPHAEHQSQSSPEWEGDRMFNIYIYDYCNKRGFHETAKKLLIEADLTPESSPPIDAKQGLLFEWWTVFWVLFTAKNNGNGNDDAMVYVQHQLQQANMRQLRPPPHMPRIINGNPGPMQNGAQGPMSFPMPPTGQQPNGIPIPSGGPTPAGANPAQPQNFNPLIAGQRPGGPQHRGPNGINPYQSPTMAHSPHNPGMNTGPSPQHPQPMGQLGPSPHMSHMGGQNRMLPPGATMGAVPSAQTSFTQLSRSPSRPNTPGQNMMQSSPSLTNRQLLETQFNNELQRLGVTALNQAKQELGLGEKENSALTFEDKQRISNHTKRIGLTQVGRKPGTAPHAGPSNPSPGMQLQGQRSGHPPQPPQVPQPLPQQQRVVKRNSTTPPDEGSLSNTDNSPQDRKRIRRSSMTMDQAPPASQYPHQQPQGGTGGPQPMPNGAMMRPGPMGGSMNSFQPHGPAGMGGNPAMGLPMGAPPMGNSMGPGMASQPQNMMMNPMQQYRQAMHTMPKNMGPVPNMVGNGGTPTPGDPGFNPGQAQPGGFPGPQNNRMVKPPGMMPPPSSPAGGPPKEQPKDGNKPAGAPNGSSHPDGSPQNHPSNPTQPGVPSAGNPQGNTAPPTPSGTSSTITASPSAVNGTPTLNPATQPTSSMSELPASFLAADFMQSVSTSLDDFDPQTLFRQTDAGIDFEQFREWFNPPEDIDGMRNE